MANSILDMIANTGGSFYDGTPPEIYPCPKPGAKVRIRFDVKHLDGNKHGCIVTEGTLVSREKQHGSDPQNVNCRLWWWSCKVKVEGAPYDWFLCDRYDDECAIFVVVVERKEYKKDETYKAWLEANAQLR